MSKKDLLKKISIGIASLALVIPLANFNNVNVNARRRNNRTHRVYHQRKQSRRNNRKNRKAPRKNKNKRTRRTRRNKNHKINKHRQNTKRNRNKRNKRFKRTRKNAKQVNRRQRRNKFSRRRNLRKRNRKLNKRGYKKHGNKKRAKYSARKHHKSNATNLSPINNNNNNNNSSNNTSNPVAPKQSGNSNNNSITNGTVTIPKNSQGYIDWFRHPQFSNPLANKFGLNVYDLAYFDNHQNDENYPRKDVTVDQDGGPYDEQVRSHAELESEHNPFRNWTPSQFTANASKMVNTYNHPGFIDSASSDFNYDPELSLLQAFVDAEPNAQEGENVGNATYY